MKDKALRYGSSFIRQTGKARAFLGGISDMLWVQKLNSPLGLLFLLAAVVPVAVKLATMDFKIAIVAFIAMIGLPLIAFTVINVAFAVGMMLFTALMIVFSAKFTTAPIGTLLDLLILLSIVAIIVRQIQQRDWSFLKNPMSYIIMAWLYFNIVQVLNPWAESKEAWLFTVRSVAIQQLVFFIACYAFKDNKKALMTIFKMIVILCFASALYGLKQEFFGFSAAEKAWINSDKERFTLYYQWGRMRIPSFCFDPTTFGILMACFSLLCIALLGGPFNRSQKIWLSIMLICSLWVNGYTGTRTAYVLIPAGAVFYAALIFNRKVFFASLIFMALGTAFILKSSSSGVVYRIQSAFRPAEDDSMNLRLENQKYIQPFIQSHPIGAGLGSCGVWGKRFNPDSELSKFPHDSSFVRMGVELGWIGLFLYTLLHYFAIRTGLYYFMRCTDPLIKSIYAAITTWVFMLAIACYAQEAILQQPMNVIYNVFLGMLVMLKNFDPSFQKDDLAPVTALDATTISNQLTTNNIDDHV